MRQIKIFILLVVAVFPDQISAEVWPTVSKFITCDFGPRGSGQFHKGIDIRASIGTDVFAVNGEYGGEYGVRLDKLDKLTPLI